MNIEKALAALDKARAEILALKEPKISTKEMIVKFCATPKTQREIRTELGLSKSVVQRYVRDMADVTLFCVGDYPPLWCSKAEKRVKQPLTKKIMTKWQPVKPWGAK